MIEYIAEFVVKEEARGRFELAYGPGGAWSKLFARSPGFRGITLLRDTRDPGRFLVIEVWETEAGRAQVLSEHKDELADLDTTLTEWTASRTELGVFRMHAEAAVRPIRRRGQGSAGRTRGRNPGARH